MALDLDRLSKKSDSPARSGEQVYTRKVAQFLSRDFKLFGAGLPDNKKEAFYSELSILLEAGLDIRKSLEIIIAEQNKERDQKLFQAIYKDVITGKTLSEALRSTGLFSPYEFYSLQIGEESGKFIIVLNTLSKYFSKKIRQRKQVIQAMTYPILVLITAILAVGFMLKFIVPMFSEVFKRFQGELPPLTRFIISLSESFSGFILILSLILIFSGIFIYLSKEKVWYKRISSHLLLSLPIIGKIVSKIYIANFCQAMALLMGSSLPMLKALKLTGNMIRFYPLKSAIEGMEKDILHGKLLSQSMMRFPIFDRRIVALTSIAEESNQLEHVFGKINEQYSAELEQRIGLLGNLLEPIMIILIGLLVAIILIAMYLPLFQISTSFI
jgi:type IV pilus assembly protein PilC